MTQVADGGRKSGEILLTEFLSKKNVPLCFLKEVFVENTVTSSPALKGLVGKLELTGNCFSLNFPG